MWHTTHFNQGDNMEKAILIIGHGSRYEYNENVIDLQKRRLEGMGFKNVYVGFNERSSPTISEAMEQIASDGMDEVDAVPFFIASGLHMVRDIPPKLGLTDGNVDQKVSIGGRDIQVHFKTPFMEEEVLAEILRDNITKLRRGDNYGILVIGHGSKLPYNKEIITLNTERLCGMEFKNVLPAFNEFDEPTIEHQFERLVGCGVDEIIVLPLFISLGDHLKNDVPPKIGLVNGQSEGVVERDGRRIRVAYSAPIGEDPRLTAVLASKLGQMQNVVQ